MKIEVGTEYQISEEIRRNFNSAETLTIIRLTDNIVQFTLNEHKGHGAMPLQHLHYLLKKGQLSLEKRRRELLIKDENDTQIV